MRKLELSQKRGTRQEEASFLRVVAAFGVEYHRWVTLPAGRRSGDGAWRCRGQRRGCLRMGFCVESRWIYGEWWSADGGEGV